MGSVSCIRMSKSEGKERKKASVKFDIFQKHDFERISYKILERIAALNICTYTSQVQPADTLGSSLKTSKINCHEMSNLSDPCCFPEWRCWGKKFLTQVVDCPRELLDERNHKLGPSASKHRGPLQLAGRLLRGVLRYSKNQTFPEFSAWKLDRWHLSTLLELPPDTWRRSVRQAGQVTRIES